MTTEPMQHHLRANRAKLPLLALFVVAGLLGNYFRYPILLNIDFLFGGIFAMLALQFIGVGAAVAASFVISGSTYFFWNHPYAIIIMTAEVAAVGWLSRRRGLGLVLSDLLFWLVVGMPMVYLFYHVVMRVPGGHTYLTMIKQALNGVANALAARLIVICYLVSTRSSLVSYRDIVYNLLAFFVLCPTLILVAVGSRTDFARTDASVRAGLIQDLTRDQERLQTWVHNRKGPILHLAEDAARTPLPLMQKMIEHSRRSDPNFLRIGLADRNATTIAFFPLVDDLGKSAIGKNYADRPFIPRMRQTLKPMLTEMVIARMGRPKPIVNLVAPVVADGRYGGYVVGTLSLEQVKSYLDRSTQDSSKLYTLVDRNGNIIMTNRPDQKVMKPFTRPEGTLRRLDSRISQWTPRLGHHSPVSNRWEHSYYVADGSIGDLAEWRLVLEQPMAPFAVRLFESCADKLVMLFLILLAALALAEVLSRRFIATQQTLQIITRDLPGKVANGEEIQWPQSGIAEVRELVRNFQAAGVSLGEHFYEIQQMNESLEQRVAERTEEVSNLMHELDIILDNAPVGICKTADRRVEWCNGRMTEIFGYSKEELTSRDTRGFYPSEAQYREIAERAYPLLAQGMVFDSEQEAVGKDGRLIPARFIGKAIDPCDLSRGCIWLVEDIRQRKQEEAERRAFEEQLQETQRLESLGVLAGGIAHDFNNLLTVIIGNCALARMNPSDIETRVGEIEKASDRAAALCSQMLEYSGHAITSKSRIDVAPVVCDLVDMLTSTAPGKVSVHRTVAPGLPWVHADATQIRQVAMNLVVNAIESLLDGPGEVTVRLAGRSVTGEDQQRDHLGRSIPPGSYVCLTVSDDGCGMSEETLRRVFEPFFTTKFTGRGLGLSATLGIVSGHGGAVQVESLPGKGSTFTVYLPALPPAAVPAQAAPAGSPAPWKGHGTVLLVEDEEELRHIAATILSELGFTVVEAANGLEALEVYRREQPVRLVITDIGMPVMDGYRLFAELKKQDPRLPIVISSGFGDKMISSMIPEGERYSLNKPYTPKKMQELLRSILG